MKGADCIKREQLATIGRLALDVAGANEPAIISFTRPRPNIVYLTFARAPKGRSGRLALETLFGEIVGEARNNGDRIVLASREMEAMFGDHPLLTGLKLSA